MTDTLSDFCFAPTAGARQHLRDEGVPDDRIHVTGNTVVDALLGVQEAGVPIDDPTLRELVDGGRPMVLLTAHRRESFGAPIRTLFRTVRTLSDRYPELEILYPVHPNPQVREPAVEILADHDRIHLVDPLSYTDLVHALEASVLVMTDSGGIQEEAPTFATPVLVLREVTERPEGVDAGVATLVGTDPDRILQAAAKVLDHRRSDGRASNPYGDGRAGERIADILSSTLLGKERALSDWSGA